MGERHRDAVPEPVPPDFSAVTRTPTALPFPLARVLDLQRTAGNAAVGRMIARQERGGTATAQDTRRYTLTVHGQRHEELTAERAVAVLDRHRRYLSDMVDVGFETHGFLRRNREEHSIVGWVADTLGGVTCPPMEMWAVPRATLTEAQAALVVRDVERASALVDRADAEYRRCDRRVYAYREGTISGAEIGEDIAIGVAVTCAVVFVVAGGVAVAGAGAAGAGGVGAGAGAAGAGGAGAGAVGGTAAAAAGGEAATAVGGTAAAAAGGEAATAAAAIGSEVAAGAGGAAVSVESAVASGAVNAGGRLFQVLGAMESGFVSAAPRTGAAALQVIVQATRSIGLDVGVGAMAAGGTIVLQNVGDVTTYIFTTGQVLVMRGAQVLLNLVP